MAQKKDIEYFLAQARRIAAHREEDSERIIRKIYKHMLKDLQTFVSDTYVKYAEDDVLTFAMLQRAGYNARFLEEVEKNINVATPKAAKELRALVEETYRIAYEGMVDGVAKAGVEGLDKVFAESIAITPEQIKAAVENPVSGLTLKDTLEKNRREIIYSIKQTVGVGLMNGDRYTTMAKRIAEQVDGDYKKAIRIARTEAHRVREAGNHDAALYVDDKLQKGTTGMRMVKKWITMKDERVRPQRRRKGKKGWSTKMGRGPNHMVLDGQVVLSNEPFDLGSGVKAMAPGQSGVAGHDINCRCCVSYEMLTDAEYFAKTGKHFPGHKGIENYENGGTIVDEKMYPPELGGAKRGEPMTFEEADSMHVNPNYGMKGYDINCQSCVVCFEARQRGYDVYTMPNLSGSMAEKLSRKTNLAWIDPATGKNPEYITDRTKAYTAKSYLKYLDGIIEQGGRYTLEFGWKGRGRSGHIVNLDRTADGMLRIKDNQRGVRAVKRYVKDRFETSFIEEQSEWIGSQEVLKYLSQFKYKTTSYGHTFYMTPKVLRIDNMRFDLDVVNQILKVVSKK